MIKIKSARSKRKVFSLQFINFTNGVNILIGLNNFKDGMTSELAAEPITALSADAEPFQKFLTESVMKPFRKKDINKFCLFQNLYDSCVFKNI